MRDEGQGRTVQMEVLRVRHRETEIREREEKAEAPAKEAGDPPQNVVTDLAGQAGKHTW